MSVAPPPTASAADSASSPTGSNDTASRPTGSRRSRWLLFVLLGLTAVLYSWHFGSDQASSYYASWVQASAQSWKAFFFGATDQTAFITTDTPPAPLWVMGISARIFGFNTWSMLVPQAIEGVATVWLLCATVRRWASPAAGLVAGGVLAVTPVAALIFRYNRPDALLVLLLVAAAYCVVRAMERASAQWMLAAGSCLGFAFLTKFVQAFLVLPAFVLVYLVAAPASLRRRIGHVLLAGGAMAVSAGWWIAIVAVWPAGSRPYIGETQHNSILELVFGSNGINRVSGSAAPAGAPDSPGPFRLTDSVLGGQVGWLVPAAVLLLSALIWLPKPRLPRSDPRRKSVLLWGAWLAVTGIVLSFMPGHFLAVYTAELAPAVAAVVGVGGVLCWNRRGELKARWILVGAVFTTVAEALFVLGQTPEWLPLLRPTLLVAGLITVAAMVYKPGRFAAAAAIVVGLTGPVAYSICTVSALPASEEPTAGPVDHGAVSSEGLGAHLVTVLSTNSSAYSWAVATVSGQAAARYQLAINAPVMTIGGYFGTDPVPAPPDFQRFTRAHRIHFFVAGEARGTGYSTQITDWVTRTFTETEIDGVRVYDLTRPR
ncbi:MULTISPECIES: ArnT family glycosyltransferase [Amycolatopsis]|uniref:ArnT family glycosyltransferase n=1 Tax=Amycolatopsis albidoflavus TaxID=102226 RepID=A0ABW5I9X6_9PSEU